MPYNKFEYLLCWLYRETICYYLFLKAINPTVKWRDGTYRLKWGGLSKLVKDQAREKLAIDPNAAAAVAAGEAKLAAAGAASTGAVSPPSSGPASPSTPLLSDHRVDTVTSVSVPKSSPPSAHKLTMSSSNTAVNLLGASSTSNGSTQQRNNNNTKSINSTNAQQQQHKRTSSYSMIMKPSTASSSTPVSFNSDAENSLTQLLPQKSNYSSGSYQHQPYQHHQHHHSMSAPVSAALGSYSNGYTNKKYDL